MAVFKFQSFAFRCNFLSLNKLSKMDLQIRENGFSNQTLQLVNNKIPAKIYQCADLNAVKLATDALKAGEVIALPTDTVYGLACDANDPCAVQKLYDVKCRIETKPVAICVGNVADLRHWGEAEHLSDDLLHSILPGPVTIILNKTEHLNNPFLNMGVAKVGIRIPDYEFIINVANLSGFPIALTSANVSSEPSTLKVEEFRELWPRLAAVFDGGVLGNGADNKRAASTVVDLSEKGVYNILREGIAISQTDKTLQSFGIKKCS